MLFGKKIKNGKKSSKMAEFYLRQKITSWSVSYVCYFQKICPGGPD